jgi:hypothetical protein
MRIWNSMNGLNNTSYHLKVFLILMGFYSATSPADTEAGNDDISMEFLEFIADWETDQGNWVGPDGFIDDSFDQLYEVDDAKSDEGDDDNHEE